jgi:hypothetical protein
VVADRYLRTGGPVPVIYHGTLPALNQAMKDAQRASRRVPGEHYVEGVYGRERLLLQEWQDGMITWVRPREED